MELDDIIASQRVNQGNLNVAQNINENADKYAKDLGNANALGVSVDTYRQNINEYNARITQEAIDLANAGPVMQEFFADRERQALIANEPDEYERLGHLEGTFAAFKDGMDIFDANNVQDSLKRRVDRVADPVGALMNDMANDDMDEDTRAKMAQKFQSRYFTSLQQQELKQMYKEARELALMVQRPTRVKAPKVLEEISNAEGFTEIRDAFLKDPLAVLGYTGGSSIGQQWLWLLASVPAYAVGAPVGSAVSSFGGGQMEYQASLREYAQNELGYDFTDPKQIMAFMNNPEHLSAADKFASARQEGVVFWDYLAGLIAPMNPQLMAGGRALGRQLGRAITGRTFVPLKPTRISSAISAIGAKSPYLSKIDSLLSQATVGGVLGAAGEYTAQQNAGQETNWGDVFLEAVGEFFTMPVEAGFAHLGVAMNHIKQRQRAAIASKVPAVLEGLAKVVANSTLRTRSPEEFKATVQKMAGDGALKEVYVKPGELSQNARQAIASISPEVAQSMEKAEAEGGVATIPMADLLTALTNDESVIKELSQHVRVRQDGMSSVEANQWLKENQSFLQRHFQEVYRAQVAKKEFRAELNNAVKPMAEQLNVALRETMAKAYAETGVMTEADALKRADEVTTYSMRLFGAQLARVSTLLGMTPKQFMERYPNQVQAMVENFKAQSLNQPVTQGIRWSMGVKYTDPEMKVRVFDIEEKDALPYADLKTMLVEKMRNGVVNQDSGFRLTASGNDIDKWLQIGGQPSAQKVYLISQIRDDIDTIFGGMKLIESYADTKKLHKGIHVFATAMSFSGKLYRFNVIAKDFAKTEEDRVAAHAIGGAPINAEIEEITIEEVGGNPTAQGLIGVGGHVDLKTLLGNQQTVTEPLTTVRTTTLSNLMGGVNPFRRADGKGYFEPVDSKDFSKGGVYYSKEDALNQEAVEMMTSAQKVRKQYENTDEWMKASRQTEEVTQPNQLYQGQVQPVVVEATSAEISAAKENRTEFRNAVKKLITDQFPEGLIVSVQVESDGREVLISKRSTFHSLDNRATWKTMLAVLHLYDLVKNSVRKSDFEDNPHKEDPNRPDAEQIIGGWTYQSKIRIDGTEHTVNIRIARHSDGKDRVRNAKVIKTPDGYLEQLPVGTGVNRSPLSGESAIIIENADQNVKRFVEFAQTAWHGSPYVFDMFSLEHIGSGEGAQAHGWGLYFTEDMAVAERYRNSLAGGEVRFKGRSITKLHRKLEDAREYGKLAIIEELMLKQSIYEMRIDAPSQIREEFYSQADWDWFESEVVPYIERDGRVFKVEIPETDEMLDEQKYFEDQSDYVRDRLKDAWAEIEYDYELEDLTGAEIYQAFVEHYGSPKEASLAMNEHGIEGITYDGNRDGRCYVVFDDQAIQILEFYQAQMNEKRRAAYNPSEGVTRLFESADESSFVHESAHYWLNSLALLCGDIVDLPVDNRTPGEQQLLEILDGFLKWGNIEGNNAEERIRRWNSMTLDEQRDFHEQFARGYEAYLRRGKAPTSGLRKAFEMFTEWLKRIYADASELDVEMSDEVVALYDRLFMAEAEAESVKQDQHIISIFLSARAAGMSDEDFAKLQEEYRAVQNAIEASIRANRQRNHLMLRDRFEREKRNLQGKYEQILNKQRKALEKDPVYVALKVLSEPFEDDGATFYNKLSLAEVRRTANEDTAIVDAIQAKGLITNIGHRFIPIQVLADMVGAPNAKDLLIGMADALPMEEEAVERADAEFMRLYGNQPDDDGIGRSALVALAAHDPAFSNVLEKEYNALAKLTGGKKLVNEGARMYATKQVGEIPVKNLMPLAHARAEARAGKDAQKAFNDGDLVSAAIHKRNQVVQHHIARAGYEARAEIAKGLTYVKRVLKSKTVWGSYMEQIENLVARFNIAKIEYNNQSKDIKEFIADEEIAIDFDDFITNREDPHYRVHYSELSVDEFREVIDSIKALEKLGREKDTVIKDGQRQKIKEVVEELNESIGKNATAQGKTFKQKWEQNTPGAQKKQGLLRFVYSHVKIASMARIMDGDTYGAMWNTLIKRANECGDKETDMRAQLTQVMQKILEPVVALGGMHTDTVVLPGTNRPLTRQERIAFALNWGNDGNRQRLKDGFGINDQQAEVILRSLSTTEWRAVEKIWQVFETLRPQMEALELRIYGRAPRWIEYGPFEVTTSEGRVITVSGGYYPAVYDTDANERSQKHQEMKAAEGLMNKAVRAVATDRSHMKKRSAKVMRPMSLRLSHAFDALNNEVHDICWREFVIDTQKIMNGGLAETITGYYDADIRRQFRNWLSDIALGDQRPREGCEAWLSHIRQGVGLAGLGFNVVSALSQMTGLLTSATRLGSYVGVGVGQYVKNPVGMAREVAEASLFMKNRGLTRFRELNEVNALIRSADNKPEQWMDAMRSGGYLMLLKVQQIVDTVTWLGAYQQAIDNGETIEQARAMADQVVIDTQGSGMLKDLSEIERQHWLKIFTVFYGFMNNAFNLNVTALVGDRNRYRAAAKILTMSVVMPTIEGLLRAALPVVVGDDDDEDETTLAMMGKAATDVASFNLGLFVGVRELQGMANAFSGGPIWNYQGPSGLRLLGDITKAGQQVAQGEFDAALAKSLVNLGGSMFGLPAAQINRAIATGVAYEEGDIDATDIPQSVLFGVSMK